MLGASGSLLTGREGSLARPLMLRAQAAFPSRALAAAGLLSLILMLAVFAARVDAEPIEDNEPPAVAGLSIVPSSVDTTSSAQTVTVTVHITDNLSGARYVYVTFIAPGGNLTETRVLQRVSGTQTDGVYEGTVEFAHYSQPGTWSGKIYVQDYAGNHTEYLRSQLEAKGFKDTVQVDPQPSNALIQQGPKLTGTGEIGNGHLGRSVAVSSDGNTALVGGGSDNGSVGAVWVFTRTGTTWAQEAKLTASGETGAGLLGESVTLSADDNTALIGAQGDSTHTGAAWVFTRSGSTWTQQGAKLTGGGESGKGTFGSRVALAPDGSTALISGPTDNSSDGAVWTFTRSGSTWTQQGEKLTATANGEIGKGHFGSSVALSSDGTNALIGGSTDNINVGAAWAFTRSGSTWTQEGEKLTGAGEVGEGHFGSSVALSSDASTALIGGEDDNGVVGAAWAFTRSGSTWTQQGEKLTGSGEVGFGHFGHGVTMSSDGNTALIGGYGDEGSLGAVWEFVRPGSSWTQLGEKLRGGGATASAIFGFSVALSADGNTAFIGAPADNSGVGAAWVFVNPTPAPTVTNVSPNTGPTAGGTSVSITGTNLSGASAVKFGSTNAASFTVNSATSITAVSPEGTGTIDVRVTTPGGTSATSAADQFSYVSEPPPIVTAISPVKGRAAGGTTVTVTGTHLTGATAVKFGQTKAVSFVIQSATTIKAVSPAETAGTVDVTVTTPHGTSAISSADHYKFGPPTITKLTPNSGSKAGGTSVTVTGTGFAPGTSATVFKFGTTVATSVNCASMTSCAVVAPSHAVGTVDVRAKVAGMTSPKSTADQFTYN